MSVSEVWRIRAQRALQLAREGQWGEVLRRLQRKLSPRGEGPEAQEDPKAYARFRRRMRKRWRRPAIAPVRTVYCLLPERGFAKALREAASAGAWTVVALPGTELRPDIDAWIATAKDADMVTFDHDERDENGARVRPFFKPAPSPLRLRYQPYVLPAFALREIGALPRAKTVESFMHALALRHIERAAHVPVVLATAATPGVADVRLAVKTQKARGTVSVLVPFRDHPALLDRCLETLFSTTRGVRFDVLLLDNGSVEAATARVLRKYEKRTRTLRLDAPFNFAWLNNVGARAAEGTHLLLLNNDTEIIEPRWLETLLELASLPDVGAVGPRLLYPDGTLQHAGILLGVAGPAAHALIGQPAQATGHHGEAQVPHEVSAVTGACLLVERRKYFAVGGLDEEAFAVAFNDLDLCAKLAARGWRTIYTPDATLIHHESKSRGSRVSIAEDRAFELRYAPLADPYYSASFSRLCPDFRWR